ncbi:HAD-IIB family hydrolase [Chitinivibrio alkaliphilus]|uniref:sucrose-phosphate synthase n=1 Tax=Chitinivibrio alkaliphilus ACht1 TaxID=1313304 RepID=U7D6M9_9BACT|nr:HAD-IIB family hydrolase [Chitinivibrio alkaliphilus]ERP32174.1 sucrose-phosphate synthase 1 [Chitinivibrio alkaliphilus ACht1]
MDKKLVIGMVNIHGLFRGYDQELGINPDTGGQTKYVLDLVKALSQREEVKAVYVYTRQIIDKKYDASYAQLEEQINEKAWIIRIPFGPKRYLRKEKLWPHIDSFVDQTLNYIRKSKIIPHVFHGHYADGGYAASQLGLLLGVPSIFTGHSLGRSKKRRLLEKGKQEERLQETFHFDERIDAEEFSLDSAACVVTSTVQEVEEQYAEYSCYHPETMEVIPPGVDLDSFEPYDESNTDTALTRRFEHFLTEPDKPAILALARPDDRKNFATLIRAYGENRELRNKANLILIMGNRKDIKSFSPEQRKVLYEVLYLIDYYDLYGKVAYPKQHDGDEVPFAYRWAASRRGIFVNPAYTEPFGLTLLEASGSGLPIVATNDGGPQDIIMNCKNGLLIDPFDTRDMAQKMLRLLTSPDLWQQYSRAGIENTRIYYSWDNHVEKYLKDLGEIVVGNRPRIFNVAKRDYRLSQIDRIIITDIDNTLTGDENSLKEFSQLVQEMQGHIGFGIATGRNKDSAMKLLSELDVPEPDIMVTSVGTEIFYGKKQITDESWQKRINYRWDRQGIRNLFDNVEGFYYQDEPQQSKYKISYKLDMERSMSIKNIKELLWREGFHAKVVFSLGMYLDFIPIRSGDGLAIRQLSFRWGIPWENILIAGDSGNDEAMLKGETLGVVVANHSMELEKLRGYPRIYFSDKSHAGGIIDGISYYNFLDTIEIPNERID